jgi:hypothetical protein
LQACQEDGRTETGSKIKGENVKCNNTEDKETMREEEEEKR